jgi:NitT/TauT family transport system ATP-binding protein
MATMSNPVVKGESAGAVSADNLRHSRSETGQQLLDCRNVKVSFRGRKRIVEAVRDVSLNIAPGELCCIVGPSGCGKSTFLHVVAGLIRPNAGSVTLEGTAVTGPTPAIAYMTQRDTLLPWATAADNVLLPIRAVHRKDRSLAHELLQLVGLTGFENHYPGELSGGMRKRVQLARSLAQKPKLLLMDEPFAALDALTKIVIEREFLRIWEHDRISVMFVTHDLAEAISMADRVVLMSRRPGVIKEDHRIDLPRPRKADGVLTDPQYQAIYSTLWRSLEQELSEGEAQSVDR